MTEYKSKTLYKQFLWKEHKSEQKPKTKVAGGWKEIRYSYYMLVKTIWRENIYIKVSKQNNTYWK